jgi:hypothetical protein
LQGLFEGFGGKQPNLGREQLAWRRARSNVEASVDRVIGEPGITPMKRDTLLSMLASSHSLMLAIVGLGAGISHGGAKTAPEALQTFAHDVDLTLYFLAAALRGSKPASESLPQLREDHRRLVEAAGGFARRLRAGGDGPIDGEFEHAKGTGGQIRGKRFVKPTLLSRAALCTEFVLLNLQGELAFIVAGNAAAGDQIEQAFLIQLGRPTDGNL